MKQNKSIRQIICSDLQIPEDVIRCVEDTLEQACGPGGHEPTKIESVSRAPRHMVWGRAAVIVAALCLLIPGVTVLAAYASGEHLAFYRSVFGTGSRGSVQETVEYDEDGKMALNLPNSQREEVDVSTAETLVGDYLTGEGGTYQLTHYNGDITTFTVENLLYDAETGSYFLYFSLERASGGFPDLTVAPEDGECYFNLEDNENGYSLTLGGLGHMYYDSESSTENKVYINVAAVDYLGMESMIVHCSEYVEADQVTPEDIPEEYYEDLENQGDRIIFDGIGFDLGTIYLPEVTESLLATSLQVDGQTAVIFSAVGIRLRLEALPELDNGVDDVEIQYLALEYSDGTRYVIKDDANNIYNCDNATAISNDYEGWTDGTNVTYCFNRLVDPGQVAKVIVNVQELPVS